MKNTNQTPLEWLNKVLSIMIAVFHLHCLNVSAESEREREREICTQKSHFLNIRCPTVRGNKLKRFFRRTHVSDAIRSHEMLNCIHFAKDCNFKPISFFLLDVGIKYVASYCLGLRELSISDCTQITDLGMFELAKLGPNLRYLSVAKCASITDNGIKQIARLCYKLRYLNVRGCESVSDEAIEIVSRSCSRLRSLDIGKCDVTDVGLKTLSEHCPNLKKLSTKSCEMITDQGIQFVAYYCRGLQQLNIQDCPVTIEGYRTVKKFCKRCIIEHSHPGFFWNNGPSIPVPSQRTLLNQCLEHPWKIMCLLVRKLYCLP